MTNFKFWYLRKFNKNRLLCKIEITKEKNLKKVWYDVESDKEKLQNYLINPDHIYTDKNYKYFITNFQKCESIDLHNLKSSYNKSDFETAINSKLIKDTFDTIEKDKMDLKLILLMASVVLNLLTLYYILTMTGGI